MIAAKYAFILPCVWCSPDRKDDNHSNNIQINHKTHG